VGEFGKNCLLVEDTASGDAIVIDVGVEFLPPQLGEDRLLRYPDLDAIAALGDRLLAYVITHGHDDHIGGLPAAYKRNEAPIYATAFTRRRIRGRFKREGVSVPSMVPIVPGEAHRIGPFRARWLEVSHSIPDSAAVVLETPVGVVVHSGDFRVDTEPVVGPPTDLDGLAEVGDEGVRLLLADSTGAHKPGSNRGEASVREPLSRAFETAKGRIVLATFASHIQRIALVAELCRAHGRKLVLLGRGLKDNVRSARDLGLLAFEDVWLREGDVYAVPRTSLCVLATGTQGEDNSALYRLARDDHPRLSLEEGDRVIFSARVIPGNEEAVAAITAGLEARGAEVWDGSEGRHVSGHGLRGDLEALLSAVRPEWLLPVHGDVKHLEAHRALGRDMGLAQERVLDARDGDAVILSDEDACVRRSESPASDEP
jgi:ribonuclease J